MKLRLGGVRAALIVAPHPDDEIIGAAGLIRTLTTRGVRVRVVIVSDGAGSHRGSVAWPRARLVAARRRESLHALRRLQVAAPRVTFLDLPDGALAEQAARCRRVLRRVAARDGCDLIVGPADTDGHPDHRAVAAALRGVRGRVRRLDYQVWPPRARRAVRARSIAVPGGSPMKRSLIRMHRTQLGIIRDDPAGFAIARHELAAFSHPIETFGAARR